MLTQSEVMLSFLTRLLNTCLPLTRLGPTVQVRLVVKF